jgi:hypothetical protein
MTDSDEFLNDAVLYRLGYSVAARLKEARRFGSSPGAHQRSPAAGGEPSAILHEVAQQLGHDPDTPPLREGVADALARVRPRW